MENNLPNALDPEGSILFLGSGFSTGAMNIRDGNLLSGSGLREKFAEILNVDPKSYDLSTLSDEIDNSPEHNLYDLLYELFTVRSVSECQLNILKQPWLRVYTTNYDDVVELSYSKLKKNIRSFSYNDAKPNKIPEMSIIHLHGVIRKTDAQNVNDQLVLNESSYVRQHFENSPWYDEFIRDIRFSTHCFFLGYSLSDYKIASLLLQEKTVKEKTYFITTKEVDHIFSNRVRDYGSVIHLGIDGFSEAVSTLPRINRLEKPYELKGLKYVDLFKDNKSLSQPTSIEVLNLVMFGAFNEKRCLSSLPSSSYVVPRDELVENASDLVGNSKTLLVHSRLGNGKSIFLTILSHRLSQKGYKCFKCEDVSPILIQEAKVLQSLNKVVILFDSYNVAIDVIQGINDILPEARFVISIRTGIQEARLHEIQNRIPKPVDRVNLNGIKDSERKDFIKLLNESGHLSKSTAKEMNHCSDFREIVTTLFKNQNIKEKLEKELKPILEDKTLKNIVITSHLLKWVGQECDSAFLRVVTGKDAYAEAAKLKEIASEIFLFGDDELHMHSSVFSEYLIDHFFNADDVVEVVYKIVIQTVRRKKERRYNAINSSLMKVSTLKHLTKNSVDKDQLLAHLFDELHRDIEVNKEPLFWLQYSILMVDRGDLESADSFLKTAYSRAIDSEGFKTYQLDTHSLRLLLLQEQRENNSTIVGRFDSIMEKLDITISMIGEESHTTHALRVLSELNNFLQYRLKALSLSERNALLIQLNRLINILQQLPKDLLGYTDSEETLKSVEQARNILMIN